MVESQELKIGNFIQDWQIDVRHKIGRHKSGLTMRYLSDNDDGTIKIEFANLIEWQHTQLRQNKDIETMRRMEAELVNQFGTIYLKKIKPENDALVNRRQSNDISR